MTDKMKELYTKVAGDSDLQAKFEVIMAAAEKAGPEETGKKLIDFAKEAGFAFTLEEIHAFFIRLASPGEGALSDEELDAVAGGKSFKPLFSTGYIPENCKIVF